MNERRKVVNRRFFFILVFGFFVSDTTSMNSIQRNNKKERKRFSTTTILSVEDLSHFCVYRVLGFEINSSEKKMNKSLVELIFTWSQITR